MDGNIENLLIQVEKLIEEKDYKKTILLTNKILKVDPKHTLTYIHRAYCKGYLKKFKSGIKDLPKPDFTWHVKSNICGLFKYIKHRPLFMFRFGFFKAIFGGIV